MNFDSGSFIHSFLRPFIHVLKFLQTEDLAQSLLALFDYFNTIDIYAFHPLSMFVPHLSASFFSWVLILQKKTTFKNRWSMIFKARSAPLFDSCLSPLPPPAADMAAIPSPSSPPVQVANQDVMNIFMWPWRTCCFFWWQFQWAVTDSSPSRQMHHTLYA